ncbi:hypothetical protein ABW21_db0207320 [Orbilia brochopaga]|nr:hypothetical protein ABW21_db0207320 [Drechslerella brochopaga]
MKSSYRLNAQRERWSENLPARPSPPVKYADGRDDPSASRSSTGFMARPYNSQDDRMIQPPRPVCKDFVRGLCARRNCWFSHPIEHSPLAKNIQEQKEACRLIQSSGQRLNTINEDESSQTQTTPASSLQEVPVELALTDLEGLREKKKTIDLFSLYPTIKGNTKQPPSPMALSGVRADRSEDEAESVDNDDHEKVFCTGPRQARELELTRSGLAVRTMRAKRSAHRGFNHQAYRNFMKPVREYTWCSSCRSRFPNCSRCALRKQMGLPPEEPPPAEDIIRENADYYKKLFSIDDKPVVKKSRRTAEASKRLPSKPFFRYPPGTQRPDWDIDVQPENDVAHTSWNPADYPFDSSQWDLLYGSPGTNAHNKTSSAGQPSTILAPTRPVTPPVTSSRTCFATSGGTSRRTASTATPVQAANPSELRSEDAGSPKPFVLGKRPEEGIPAVLCYNCWKPGHLSKSCKSRRLRSVVEQEELRVRSNAPSNTFWQNIVRASGLKSMKPAANSLNPKIPSPRSSHHQTISRQRVEAGDPNPLADGFSTESQDNRLIIHPTHSNSSRDFHASLDAVLPVADQVQTIAYAEIDSPRLEVPLKAGSAFAMEGSEVTVVSVPTNGFVLPARRPVDRTISAAFGRSRNHFRPENARYQPVGSVAVRRTRVRIPPIFKLPNEIMLEIFKILINDRLGNFFPLGDDLNDVYNEETVLQTKNIILDGIRKTNSKWRALAQSELYQSVAISSPRSLYQFARSVHRDKNLSRLVKKIKIDIPFLAVDGWTPPDAIQSIGEERAMATRSAKSLNFIVSACFNLHSLVAKCAGAFRIPGQLQRDHRKLEELVLSDDFSRRSDIKALWDVTKRFPNLKAFEISAPDRCLVENRARVDPLVIVEVSSLGIALTSISLQSFPFISDDTLQAIIADTYQLEKLEIQGCSKISAQGKNIFLVNFPMIDR